MNEQHGMTVIVVEQKIMLLSAYAKKLAVLNGGRLELFGPVREVLRHSARLEAIGVHCPRVATLSNRLADLTGGALAADLDEAEALVRGAGGMIQFENVSLSYGRAAAVRDLSFTVGRGEFVALVGANGAGKTTVSKLMNGLLKPTAGRVLVDGVPTTSLRTSALAKKIGFLFQNPDRQLCKPTIREEIRFGLALTGAKRRGAAHRKRCSKRSGWTGTATRFRRAAASGSASRSRR